MQASRTRQAYRYGLMAYLGAVLGLRQAECAGLRVGRIDFLGGALTVAEQLTRGRHGSMATAEPKSDAGRRTLSVPPELMELLAAHLARRGLDGRHSDAFVFASPGGAPLDYTNWRRRIWKPATVKAGLHGLTFHDLRRANATGLVAEGVDVRTAQARQRRESRCAINVPSQQKRGPASFSVTPSDLLLSSRDGGI